MSDFLPALPPAVDLLPALLDLSISGVVYYLPVRDEAGEVVDLALAYLNPMAQRLLSLPARPEDVTYRRLFPGSAEAGLWEFHRAALLAGGEERRLSQYYQADGLDGYFEVAARQVGEGLLASFTDHGGLSRSSAARALQASNAREQAARAEAETQRQRLHQLLMQLPTKVALFSGPTHVYELLNPRYQQLFGDRPLLGRPYREALPEQAGTDFAAALDRVYQTGQPAYLPASEAWADYHNTGQLERRYFNTRFEPVRDAQGQITGVLNTATDVTAQVEARQQVEQLNHELEARVRERTRQLSEQQALLSQIMGQLPAAIATLSGPDHRYTFFNTDYQTLVGGRARLGAPVAELLPELAAQGFTARLDEVYATQQPFGRRAAPVQLTGAAGSPSRQLYLDLSYQALRDGRGQSVGILAFLVDVTASEQARRQADTLQAAMLAAAQRQAQRREELYQVFEQAPAAIVLLREPHHRIEYCNPAYQRLFAGRELRGHLLAEARPEVHANGALARIDRVFATGEPAVGEEEALDVTAGPGQPPQTRYFNFTYQPYREDDAIVGVSVFAYDVTEQVRTRRAITQELTRQEQELRHVFEQAPVAIAIFRGPRYVIELANPTVCELWGRTPAQALGTPLFELLPEAAGQGFEQLLDNVMTTGKPYVAHELPSLIDRHGQRDTVYWNFVYQPLRESGHDDITAVLVVATEATEQVLARRQAEQANQELEARVAERTQEAQAAHTAAERERALLQALLTQAPVAIALFQGEELRVTAANEMVAAMWDQPLPQVLNRPLLEGVPELRSQGFDDMLRQVLATRVPVTGTETPAVLRRDGELKTTYYNFVYQPLYNAEGEVLGVIDVAIEVTEQVEARQRIEQLGREAELARAEAERQRGELARVFEQAPVAIAVLRGPRYVIELANPTVARLWGRTREQLIGKALLEALPEVAGQGFEQLLDGVLATGVPYTTYAREAQLEREGRLDTVYLDFVYVPTYAADGRIDGVLVVANEVTAQVRARRQVEQLNQELEARVAERTRQLSEQQALLRQILGQVPASIATLGGSEHRFTFFNELYQGLVGGRAALGLSVAEALPEVVEQGFIGLLDRVYATGEPFVGTDMPVLLDAEAGGESRQYYVDFIYQPLFDAQQQVQGILAFVVDVTDRARARQQVQALNQELTVTNQELRASNARLLRTNTDLDTFVYTASHDLKAPITNIEGLLEALRDYLPVDHPEPMIPQLLGLMEKSVARFLQTISQLTDVSRLQHATQEPAEPIALAELVENIRLDLPAALAGTPGQLHVDVAECPTVTFSPKNLRSILYNLLSNAFKYRSPERDPLVRLHASCRPGQVVLTVQDNGLGLNEAQQGKLFTLFRRLHTHVEGTGVGLYMLKRIVENAGGTIAVQSEPGVGSTFTVALPQLAG